MSRLAGRLARAYRRRGLGGLVRGGGRRFGRLVRKAPDRRGRPVVAVNQGLVLTGLAWRGAVLLLRGRLESGETRVKGAAAVDPTTRATSTTDLALTVGAAPAIPVTPAPDGRFEVAIDLAHLDLGGAQPDRPLRLPVLLAPRDRSAAGRGFGRHELLGTARWLPATTVAWHAVRPIWHAEDGLALDVTAGRARAQIDLTAQGGLRVRVEQNRRRPSRLRLALDLPDGPVDLPSGVIGAAASSATAGEPGSTVELDPAEVAAALGAPGRSGRAALVLRARGRLWPLLWTGSGAVETAGAESVRLRRSGSGETTVERVRAGLLATAVQVQGDDLVITVRTVPAGPPRRPGPVGRLSLGGARREVSGDLVVGSAGSLRAVLPLRSAVPWTSTLLPLPPGPYRITAVLGPERHAVRLSPWQLPVLLHSGPGGVSDCGVHVAVIVGVDGELGVELSAPLTAQERGRSAQDRLRHDYRRSTAALEPTSVLLSSFDGRTCADNTGAIAAELARRRPDLDLCWTSAHSGVEVPAGARVVGRDSTAWWEALGRSGIVVTNTWLPRGFRRRPGQVVLQAWHGTPFKHLGLDRRLVSDYGSRSEAIRRHASAWDLMIAQNDYSAEIFRRAYGFTGDLRVTGYPRNDALVTGIDPARLAQLRTGLGLDPGDRVVLYAPTFRDGAKAMFAELDLTELVRRLGPNTTVLVRGHAAVASRPADATRPGVVDVTLVPDVAELFALADVLVTDYSSVMFDFAVTGRPIVWFVPDLAAYVGEIRGAYFDLNEQAPGPLATTTAEVADALGAALADGVGAGDREAYRRWSGTYVPHDDGHAAARTVDALLARLART